MWFESDWWMLGGIPFLIPEFTVQTTYFNRTYNQGAGSGITSVHNNLQERNSGKNRRVDWKRDKLIEIVQAAQEDVKTMNPDLILKLEEVLRTREE